MQVRESILFVFLEHFIDKWGLKISHCLFLLVRRRVFLSEDVKVKRYVKEDAVLAQSPE
jgi:hypothetical protein